MNFKEYIKGPIGEIIPILLILLVILITYIYARETDKIKNAVESKKEIVTKPAAPIAKEDTTQPEDFGHWFIHKPIENTTVLSDSQSRRINAEVNRMWDKLNGLPKNYPYLFKNKKPFGKEVTIMFDPFYKKYLVSWTKENGDYVEIKLLEENFKLEDPYGAWSFKYKNDIYDPSGSAELLPLR